MGSKSVALFLVMLNSNQPWIEKLYYDNILFPKKRKTNKKQTVNLHWKENAQKDTHILPNFP